MKDLTKLKSEIADVLQTGRFPHDSKVIIDKIDKSIKDKDVNSLGTYTLELWRNQETEHFIALIESVEEKYRGMIKELAFEIYKESDVKNELEKTLVEVCVGSFIRYLDNSRRLNGMLNGETITPNKNQYIANLSKQVDRAHRQYLSSLQTLMQIKQPRLSLNIKAETAFIADKQQVNSIKPENHEINESK